MRKIPLLIAFLAISVPASAQVDLTGSWAPRLYEDYIERGHGSDLGDFTGVPMPPTFRRRSSVSACRSRPGSWETNCNTVLA
jgi:hypothetical protein